MNGHEAYIRLCEAAGLIDEASLEEGRKTLGKKLNDFGKYKVADHVSDSAWNRIATNATKASRQAKSEARAAGSSRLAASTAGMKAGNAVMKKRNPEYDASRKYAKKIGMDLPRINSMPQS